jgi:hypothetical protein
LLSENNGVRILCTLLIATVAAPLVEEILFRGLLLESWRKYGIAIVLSGFAFAAWHLIGAAIIYYWLMGIVLGRVYVRRGLIGSMATHATFNTIVMGITIASISGSGHDFRAGSLQVHAPASWHNPGAAQAALRGDQLFLTGPSGSSIEFVAIPHGRTLGSGALVSATHQDMQRALSGLGSATTEIEEIDIPVGPAEHTTIDVRGRRVDVYVAVTPRWTYVIGADTASSKTAAKQIPGILNSLAEN